MNGTITRRGKGSWRIKYDLPRDESGQRRLAYATVRGKRADAEKELRRRLSAIDHGVHVDPSMITVAEYLESWLAEVAPQSVAPKALERYRGLARNQIKPHLGHIQLQKLRPADVAAWHQNLISAGIISKGTIRHAHGVLRTALSHAAAVEIVERNVASIITPPRAEQTKVAILTDGQIADMLEKIEGLSLYPIVALAIGTGARRGEIAALRWSDIDLDAATVRIERSLEQTASGLRVKDPKTKAGRRTVSLPKVTVEAIRVHRRQQLELRLAVGAGQIPDDAPVFGNLEGDWPSPFSISDRWRDAVKNRKLPKVTFHALRHSHASALIAAGLDIVSISTRLGHASPALTLGVYSHLFNNDDSKAADAIDNALAK
ncbi:MAG: site-specific integrase [Alphaproteobacteria bacterium]|nr:site-specific integrase [Alphaproteobacteria bacterium]